MGAGAAYERGHTGTSYNLYGGPEEQQAWDRGEGRKAWGLGKALDVMSGSLLLHVRSNLRSEELA